MLVRAFAAAIAVQQEVPGNSNYSIVTNADMNSGRENGIGRVMAAAFSIAMNGW